MGEVFLGAKHETGSPKFYLPKLPGDVPTGVKLNRLIK